MTASEEEEAQVMSTFGEPIQVWEPPDKAFVKKVLHKGIGFHSPLDGCTCYLKVLSDEMGLFYPVDEDSIKEFVLGEADNEVDRVVEACLLSMKEEEVCELNFSLTASTFSGRCSQRRRSSAASTRSVGSIDSPLSFTEEMVPEEGSDAEEGSPDNDEGGGGDDGKKAAETVAKQPSEEEEVDEPVLNDQVVLKFQLVMFTSEPDIWEMSITEKWRRACHNKKKGIELFAQKQVYWAFRRFSKALKYLISLEHDIPADQQEQGMDIQSLKLSCYLNLAACQLKHLQYEHVVKNCTKALKLDERNPKALFRRGVALVNLQEYERAKEDLDKAAALEPNNQAIRNQQRVLKARVQKLNNYYANAMKKMFN